MEKVLITRQIPSIALEKLSEYFYVEINTRDANFTKDELKQKGEGCFGIVSMVGDNIDKDILDTLGHVKIIANYAVGFNNIDIQYATKKGIFVTNTPDVLSQATAELTFGLILSTARRIKEANDFICSLKFKGFDPMLFLGKELYGKKLGIIGMGRIGSLVARIGRFGFNMDVLYHNRHRSQSETLVDGRRVTLDELLKTSDVITIMSSLSGDNKHMISRREFEIMKNDVVFVNTSRGDIVDTEALIKALQSNKIFACGLDVYENEPDIDKRILKFPNCIMLPHIGSATKNARYKMAEIVANNIISVYKGKCPETALNGDELCNVNK